MRTLVQALAIVMTVFGAHTVAAFDRSFIDSRLGSREWAGPNCWNTSLVVAGILPHARFTTAQEFASWMTSPLCQKIKDARQITTGTIAAVRDSSGDDHHSYIHLDQTRIFEKIGPSAEEIYRVQSASSARNSHRGFQIDYFQCEPLSTLIAPTPLTIALDNLEKEIADSTHVAGPYLPAMKADFASRIEILDVELTKAGDLPSWLPPRLRERLSSLRIQLRLLGLKL